MNEHTCTFTILFEKYYIFFKKIEVSDNEKHVLKSLLLEPMKYKRA